MMHIQSAKIDILIEPCPGYLMKVDQFGRILTETVHLGRQKVRNR